MDSEKKEDVTGRAKGGVARSAALSKEQRSAIAKKGAEARWASPQAMREGSIKLGDLELPCAVLEDGRRVLTQSGIMLALGRSRQVKSHKYFDADVNLPAFLQAKNLKPFISNDLEVTSSRIDFRTMAGSKAFGFPADVLPSICEVFIDAEREGKLIESQKHIAVRARMLYKGFAKLGIVALIDEATGYQEVRDKKALQALLDKYLRQEHAVWAKRFPDDFYKEMFRLKTWDYPTPSGGKPGVVGTYTNDLVYERLAPGLLRELEKRNPKAENGRRKSTHHQWMTEDIGDPALTTHIHSVMGLMRASDSWDQLLRMMDRAYPKKGTQIPLIE